MKSLFIFFAVAMVCVDAFANTKIKVMTYTSTSSCNEALDLVEKSIKDESEVKSLLEENGYSMQDLLGYETGTCSIENHYFLFKKTTFHEVPLFFVVKSE